MRGCTTRGASKGEGRDESWVCLGSQGRTSWCISTTLRPPDIAAAELTPRSGFFSARRILMALSIRGGPRVPEAGSSLARHANDANCRPIRAWERPMRNATPSSDSRKIICHRLGRGRLLRDHTLGWAQARDEAMG